MNPKIRFLSASLFAAALLASGPACAADKKFPANLAGVWVGNGAIYQAPGAPRERVRCRFSSKWASAASAISLRYICLGIDIKFETTGTLKYVSAKRSIAGKLVVVGIGAFRATGTHKGKRISMRLSGKDRQTGKPVTGQLSIALNSNNAFTSTLTATDPKSGKKFQPFKARFKR